MNYLKWLIQVQFMLPRNAQGQLFLIMSIMRNLVILLSVILTVRSHRLMAACPTAVLQSKSASARGWKAGYPEFISYGLPKIKIYKECEKTTDQFSEGTKPYGISNKSAIYEKTKTKAVLSNPLAFTPNVLLGNCSKATFTELILSCSGYFDTYNGNNPSVIECHLTLNGPPCIYDSPCQMSPIGFPPSAFVAYPSGATAVPPDSPLSTPTSEVITRRAYDLSNPGKLVYKDDKTTVLSEEFTTEDLSQQIRNRIPAYPPNFSDGGAQAYYELSESEVCGAGGRVSYRFKTKGDAGRRIRVQASKSHYNKQGKLISTAPITFYATGAGQDTWVYTEDREENVPGSEGRVVIAFDSASYDESGGGRIGGLGGPGSGGVGGGLSSVGGGAGPAGAAGGCSSCGGSSGVGGTGGLNGAAGTVSGLSLGGGADWQVGLGATSAGGSAGTLSLFVPTPSPEMYKPSSIAMNLAPEALRWQNQSPGTGDDFQISTPLTFVAFKQIGVNEYQVRFYELNAGLALTGSASAGWSYNPVAVPFRTWAFSNPDGTGASGTNLKIVETTGGATREYIYSYLVLAGGVAAWTLNTPGSLYDEVKTSWTDGNGDGMQRVARRNHGGSVDVEVVTRRFRKFNWGHALIEEDLGGLGRVNKWDYYSSDLTIPNAGVSTDCNSCNPTPPLIDSTTPAIYPGGSMLKVETRWDGAWTQYTYDGPDKRISKIESRYGTSTAPYKIRSIEYGYAPEPLQGDSSSTDYSGMVRKITEKVDAAVISCTWHAYSPGVHKEVRGWWSGAVANDPNNLVTIEYFHTTGPLIGQLKYTSYPDGTATFFVNDPSFTTLGVLIPGSKTRSTASGQPKVDLSGIQEGTITTEVTGDLGDLISRKTEYIKTGVVGPILDQMTFFTSDAWKRPNDVLFLDGTHELTSYACCGVDSTTGRDGVLTQYNYDAGRRFTGTTRLGITLRSILTAADRVERFERIGTDNVVKVLETLSYDSAGMVYQKLNPLGGSTTISRNLTDQIGGDLTSRRLIQTTTEVTDGGTRIEEFGFNGETIKVTGTGTFPVRYEYGTADMIGIPGSGPTPESEPQTWQSTVASTTKTIPMIVTGTDLSNNPIYADGTEITTSFKDPLGHEIVKSYSDGAKEYRAYNNKGQLIWESDPDGVTTLFGYNTKGQLEITALDVNNDKDIDLNGTDRVTKTVGDVQLATVGGFSQGWYRTSTTSELGVNESTVESTTAVTYISPDGLRSVSSAFGTTTTSLTLIAGVNRTQTVTEPDLSYTLTTYANGRMLEVAKYNSGGTLVTKTSYGYDPHGRLMTSTDSRNGASSFAYDPADNLEYVTTPAMGEPPQVTRYIFDGANRLRRTLQSDGTETWQSYHPTGQLEKTYGTRIYPVEYTYDSLGRMKTMKTWKDFNQTSGTGISDPAVTTWSYHPTRGWLSTKRYADSQGTDYNYTLGGRLETRKWKRLAGAPQLMTEYKYNLISKGATTQSGDLSGIVYNDGTTPRIAFGYDRRGRRNLAEQYNSTSVLIRQASLEWYDSGRFKRETRTVGGLTGWYTHLNYDPQLRRLDLTVNNGGTAPLSQSYSYDTAGRLQTTGFGPAAANTESATYSYEPQSALINQIAFKSGASLKLITGRSYDALNRLRSTTSTSALAGQPQLGTTYTYNSANQRVQSISAADGSYWVYQYDALGQVTSGRRFWRDGTPVEGQQFEYAFDQIGNRTASKSGGDASGQNLRSTGYAPANSLNQYVGSNSRSNPRYLEVQGAAWANQTVTIKNGAVDLGAPVRQGEYFRREVSIAGTGPVWQNVDVAVTGGTSLLGNKMFIPPQAEAFVYDLDGNLTQDGRWDYVWDAENRLVEVRTTVTANGAGTPGQKVTYEYDWQGRLVKRSTFTGTPPSTWTAGAVTQYMYDGWNCVAEFDGAGTWQRVNLWGTDLSGSRTGAGGVGGLLAIKSSANGTHFTAYDGNGNILGLYNAADGTCSARYEYDPFGSTLRVSGSAIAAENLWRFSTKRSDAITDLVHYEYRVYSPMVGRWLSRDPIGELFESNVYCINLNGPINTYDYFGLNTPLPYVGPGNFAGPNNMLELMPGEAYNSARARRNKNQISRCHTCGRLLNPMQGVLDEQPPKSLGGPMYSMRQCDGPGGCSPSQGGQISAARSRGQLALLRAGAIAGLASLAAGAAEYISDTMDKNIMSTAELSHAAARRKCELEAQNAGIWGCSCCTITAVMTYSSSEFEQTGPVTRGIRKLLGVESPGGPAGSLVSASYQSFLQHGRCSSTIDPPSISSPRTLLKSYRYDM